MPAGLRYAQPQLGCEQREMVPPAPRRSCGFSQSRLNTLRCGALNQVSSIGDATLCCQRDATRSCFRIAWDLSAERPQILAEILEIDPVAVDDRARHSVNPLRAW